MPKVAIFDTIGVRDTSYKNTQLERVKDTAVEVDIADQEVDVGQCGTP